MNKTITYDGKITEEIIDVATDYLIEQDINDCYYLEEFGYREFDKWLALIDLHLTDEDYEDLFDTITDLIHDELQTRESMIDDYF